MNEDREPEIKYSEEDCQAVEGIYINMGAILLAISSTIDQARRGVKIDSETLDKFHNAVKRLTDERQAAARGFSLLEQHRDSCLGPKRKVFDNLCQLIPLSFAYIDALLKPLNNFILPNGGLNRTLISEIEFDMSELQQNVSKLITMNPAYIAYVEYMRSRPRVEAASS